MRHSSTASLRRRRRLCRCSDGWSYDACDGATGCDGVDVDVNPSVDAYYGEASSDVMVDTALRWDEAEPNLDELYDAQVIADNGMFYGVEQTLVDLDNLPSESGEYFVCIVLRDSSFDGGVSGEVVQAGDDGETELSGRAPATWAARTTAST